MARAGKVFVQNLGETLVAKCSFGGRKILSWVLARWMDDGRWMEVPSLVISHGVHWCQIFTELYHERCIPHAFKATFMCVCVCVCVCVFIVVDHASEL